MCGIIRKKKRTALAAILALALCASCAGCGSGDQDAVIQDGSDSRSQVQDGQEESPGSSLASDTGEEAGDTFSGSGNDGEEASGSGDTPTDDGSHTFAALPAGRPVLVAESMPETDVEADTAPYTIQPDLSNLDNLWQFQLDEEMARMLAGNGFVVSGNAGDEFFEIYELNRYFQIPSFVTVDSMMHTYHLYFGYLLKKVEKESLEGQLTRLSRRMLDNCKAQYEVLKGSEWAGAAARNMAFFTVGASLLEDGVEVNPDVAEMVRYELDNIGKAEGIFLSELTGEMEDYTQYAPRGYYEGDAQLERYFRAMMWYGRIHFSQDNEDLDRSALLMTLALSGDGEAGRLWEGLYAVTSFFAGASDDAGVCEYGGAIREVYGEDIRTEELVGREADFQRFHELTADLKVPAVNSVPVRDGQDNVIPGFRFMGQRFTIDAAIMQKLIYSAVEENNAGARRMLPDVLDVPAALGSDTALGILTENGAAEYAGYSENMEWLRRGLAMENTELWSNSLYAGWLNTLRPLLSVKGEGYPLFMQGEEWRKRSLECFAGSFTELKHDTVLYAKQVIAEMGGGYDENVPDDRGYVEPEPVVYARFAHLARMTGQGLKGYDMLTAEDEENLGILAEFAERLQAISEKELRDEVLSAEEYDFIKGYGGSIEHFWREAIKWEAGTDWIAVEEYPAALVVDIATDPNGQVLEAATGDPSEIYVVVQVDGVVKIARGSVYTFYQFPWPMEDRLTDAKWRVMMGLQVDEEGYYRDDKPVRRPAWTESYRYDNGWD